jgi:hypothetical protein
MKEIVVKFIEYYTEMYGKPEFSVSENRNVISDEDIKNIYDNYIGFDNITFTELCTVLEETYYVDYGFQDSF